MKFDAFDVVENDEVPPVLFVTQLAVIELDTEVHDMLSDNPNEAVVTVVSCVLLFDQSTRRKIVMP